MRSLVLITGAASGIGQAAAQACAEAGFEVIATMADLAMRDSVEADAVHVEQLDVTSIDAGAKVRELLLKYGPIDCLVNNAAIARSGVFEETEDADVREQFETNVFGTMAVTRALLPSMRASRRGRILNISSISGRVGVPGLAAYAATRHAVSGFSEALRHELEPFGIAVCLVEPGDLESAMGPGTGAGPRGDASHPGSRGDTPHPGARGDTPQPGARGDTPHPGARCRPAPPSEPPSQEGGPYAEIHRLLASLGPALARGRRRMSRPSSSPPADGGPNSEHLPSPDHLLVGRKIAELLRAESPPFRTVVGSHARAIAALRRVAPEGLWGGTIRRLMGL